MVSVKKYKMVEPKKDRSLTDHVLRIYLGRKSILLVGYVRKTEEAHI